MENKKSILNKKINTEKFSTKDYGMVVLGIFSVLYLLNFSFGVVEFLPDNLPLIGNIDEVLVVGVLVSVFEYFGINVTRWFKRPQNK